MPLLSGMREVIGGKTVFRAGCMREVSIFATEGSRSSNCNAGKMSEQCRVARTNARLA